MDFDLSEDQLALRQAAASLMQAKAGPQRAREVAAVGSLYDSRLWSAMAEQGWQAVETPDEGDGLGLGSVETAVLCEEVGRSLASVPLAATVAVGGALRRALARVPGPEGGGIGGVGLADWAGRLARGEAVGAVSWDLAAGAMSARSHEGRWLVSGTTDPFVHAPAADLVVMAATTPQGVGLFVTAPARPSALSAMDLTRSIGRLALSDEPAVRIGDAPEVSELVDRLTVGLCAEMLGGADRVLEMTVQYAKDRVQFGRPIGSFQAVKHRCADMLVDVEGMRSVTYYAAWAVGAADSDSSSAASAAKVWCADASRRVMASALQVHGGIGFTWEHDLHLYLKRAQLDQVSYGDARYHRDRLAEMLRPKAEAGLPVL